MIIIIGWLPWRFRHGVSRQCCASPRSFTVVVLMRDESGYMMLLLVPFHQQWTPTITLQNNRNDTAGFPPDSQQPTLINRRSARCPNRDARRRIIRGVYFAAALDAFPLPSQPFRLGLTLTRKSALTPRACSSTPTPAILFIYLFILLENLDPLLEEPMESTLA